LLVPVFGSWFGWKLTRAGSGPGSLGRAFGLALAALAVLPLTAFLARKAGIVPERMWRPNVPVTSLTILSVFVVVFFVGVAIGILAWPALGRTLLAYGLAARVPVALLMLVAMLGNWGTHYDARPSYPPQMSTLAWWVALGLVPQLSFWIWYTIGFGAPFGIVAAAIARRRGAAAS
jgi:predicted lysophospholipase L1 biosynthesis ABC-type transport system permease subunit